jgi:hypothetical protein
MSSDTSNGASSDTSNDPITAAPPGPEEATLTQALAPATPPTATLATPTDDAARTGATAVEPSGRHTRGIRMRTVVLGLVLLAVSATSLLRVLTDVNIDDSLVVLILLVVAGALLLGGGVASAARESRAARVRR